ncbi:hypothetical protein AAIB33_12635 [Microbacterium sp. AZCO]|uniref:hypothetical protein n=1 Tax=Microbacterium sp. AZCO TaxID=3142976 RepID=UPI0031F372F6
MMRQARHAITREEQIARYAYVLGAVPASVADRGYAAAFARLPEGQREGIVAELRSEMPVPAEASTPADPEAFALFMRDLHARSALVRIPHAGTLAAEFIASPPIVHYFSSGVGSVSIDQHPPWLHELAGHETAPIDAGRINHRKGVNTGIWLG